MHRTGPLRCALLALAPFASAPFAPAAAVPSVQVTVHAAETGKPISPDLVGIFFEDLNYAADGGLYAELIQNRSFEYDATEQKAWNPLSFWELEQRGGGKGDVSVSTAAPLHPNNPHYAAIGVKEPGDGVGLRNPGFDGIPVRAGEAYDFSCFSHQLYRGEKWTPHNGIDGKPMPVTVRLEAPNGDLLAELKFDVSGRPWQRYDGALTPSRDETGARLVLLAHAPGGLAVDHVSLFPRQTFRGRPNGLRADLAQVIADLRPRFVRFPGGCLAHGDGLGNMYRWKDTIGPVETRRGQRNLWGYHQSVGLGYYEYFQFCEDIGAKPLPVVPAGVCCQNADNSPGMGQAGLPLAEMPAYIQEVLDLIEWANGPATSVWGAKRAAAGHPAPFGLTYLGVGNEDKITPEFEARFKMIQEAVQAKHPGIVVIGTSGPFPDGEDFERGWKVARELKTPMVDEHYYRSPEWFWDNLRRYDGYDRNGPKVYVGEYAAHERDRRSTLRSALAEAAALTTFERNGDLVHLTSYAPLLARRGHTQWTPDLIYFTGTAVYPTINYQVQRLFALHRGDHYVGTTVAAEGTPFAASTVRDSKSGDLIVKLVNGGAATPVKLRLEGLPAGGVTARQVVLAHDDPAIANEDGQPAAVAPVTTDARITPDFDYAAPAHSLTILRFAAPRTN